MKPDARVKLGKWTVGAAELKAYEDHLMLRIGGVDHRDETTKEFERRKLHLAIKRSAIPKIPIGGEDRKSLVEQDEIDFDIALGKREDAEFGGLINMASWR